MESELEKSGRTCKGAASPSPAEQLPVSREASEAPVKSRRRAGGRREDERAARGLMCKGAARESQALASGRRRCRGGAGEAVSRSSVSGERWIGTWFYAPWATLIAHGGGFLAETPCGLARMQVQFQFWGAYKFIRFALMACEN